MSGMTPREIVHELDKHIVGQGQAKRAVAVALRNRWRRAQLAEELRREVTPKNILMIGPTGVGKTEIARRLARLADAPFIKVEATRFTEVGYVGRDVESIVRELVDTAVSMVRTRETEKVRHRAAAAAEERLLDALLPSGQQGERRGGSEAREETRRKLRGRIRAGELDEREVEIEVSAPQAGVEIMTPPGMEDMKSQLQGLFQSLGSGRTRTRKVAVKEALRLLEEEAAAKLLDEDEIKAQALRDTEENAIVFIDEIDKVARRGEHHHGTDVSREGVQRDLLPLVEGCTVNTRYGTVRTDHVLFIASGAFHVSRPSDLIPELQGRLPIRVELEALKTDDFVRILTEPDASLTEQYAALLETERVRVEFAPDGVARIAEIAWQVNESTENIGARRLHTVMERLVEEISFEAPDRGGETVTVDADYVDRRLSELLANEDLTRYIL